MSEMAKKKESTPGENLAKQIIEQYHPKSVADMQNALKDIFGPMFEAMSTLKRCATRMLTALFLEKLRISRFKVLTDIRGLLHIEITYSQMVSKRTYKLSHCKLSY